MKPATKEKEFDVHFTSVITPIGTIAIVCAFWKNQRIISRGVAICSLRDNFKNKEGKNLAYKRAYKAYLSKRASGEIKAEPNKIYMVKRTIRLKNSISEDTPICEFIYSESKKYFWRNDNTIDAYFPHIFPAKFLKNKFDIKYKSEYFAY